MLKGFRLLSIFVRATREASKSKKFADVLKERELRRFHDEEEQIIAVRWGPLKILKSRVREF